MITVNLTGTITSKIAFHVPVFRRWRLVWERRDFGTRVEEVEASIPVGTFAGTFTPKVIPIGDKGSLVISVEKEGYVNYLVVSFRYMGEEVPGLKKYIPIPTEFKRFEWSKHVWRGVVIDLSVSVADPKPTLPGAG